MTPHTPRFGLNLHTTINHTDPVRTGQHAEQLGFDLVSVHRDVLGAAPPSYEMWTLMTWLAARTSTISVASNVLAVPNRHPALLAKMAATLDQLSSHRLILALGAGAPMNAAAVRSVGLSPHSRGASVAALRDLIDILRGLWSAEPFTHQGVLADLDDAVVFPRPTRPIPIWVGGYGPRLLQLVGEQADGWLPSAFILPPGRTAESIARIERAAETVGRDPAKVTLAYNVGVHVGNNATERPGQVQGSVDGVAAGLADLVRIGFNLVNLWPVDNSEASRERLATAVLPQVRDRLS